MIDFLTLLLGNSFGMLIANVASIMIFAMLTWGIIENLYLPERISTAINESTMFIPNWLIIQLYVFGCFLTILFL